MSAAGIQLGLLSGASLAEARREERTPLVRLVECTPFPRVRPDERPLSGATRDVSTRGLCVSLDRTLPRGALVRVRVREIDGRPLRDALARVIWSRPASSGRSATLGLELLVDAEKARPRPTRPAMALALSG